MKGPGQSRAPLAQCFDIRSQLLSEAQQEVIKGVKKKDFSFTQNYSGYHKGVDCFVFLFFFFFLFLILGLNLGPSAN